MKNCVNCGAPIEIDKKVCPYCKTPYDVSGFKAEIGEMFGEITIGGKTSRVYLGNVERIAIRDCANFEGLTSGWYRVAVRQYEENEQLIAAIRSVGKE